MPHKDGDSIREAAFILGKHIDVVVGSDERSCEVDVARKNLARTDRWCVPLYVLY